MLSLSNWLVLQSKFSYDSPCRRPALHITLITFVLRKRLNFSLSFLLYAIQSRALLSEVATKIKERTKRSQSFADILAWRTAPTHHKQITKQQNGRGNVLLFSRRGSWHLHPLINRARCSVYNNQNLPFKARKVKYYQQYCDETLSLMLLFTDRFIRNLILIIVLPLTLAALFVVVVCLKFRPSCKSSPDKYEPVSIH